LIILIIDYIQLIVATLIKTCATYPERFCSRTSGGRL